ncbi:hypothetical protein [Streptomyces sp. NPDC094049]|uniref:hypothetical protein n=1 Tax=Streptomyces sp. NPDC094049 TaxID=3154987 RepID=UPI003326553A
MTPPEASAFAVELANLRGDLSRDLGDIKTSCAVLVERSNRVEQDVRDLRTDTESDAAALRAEIEELKRNRWPLPAVAALTGLAALGLTLYEIVAR